MKAIDYFLVIGAIYIAPHLTPEVGGTFGVVAIAIGILISLLGRR